MHAHARPPRRQHRCADCSGTAAQRPHAPRHPAMACPRQHHLRRHGGQRHGVVLPRIGSSARRHDHHRVGRRVVVLTREPVDASYCRTVSDSTERGRGRGGGPQEGFPGRWGQDDLPWTPSPIASQLSTPSRTTARATVGGCRRPGVLRAWRDHIGRAHLLLAELRAGLIDAEIFTRDDPTGPTWVGLRSGLPTWGGDGTSGTAQRDRVRAAFIASGFSWPGSLGRDGRIGGTACGLGANTPPYLVERYKR